MFWPLFWLAFWFTVASILLAVAFCTPHHGRTEEILTYAGMGCCLLGVVAAMVSDQVCH